MSFSANCGVEAGAGYYCSSCGHPLTTEVERRYPPPPTTPPVADDPGFPHLLRFIGVGFLVSMSMYLLVGFFWMAHIYSRTGHRKRDLLWMFVPVWGTVVQVRSLWRYTARRIDWDSHDGRPNDLLRGWQRPWAIGAGWVLVPLFCLGVIVAAVAASFGWSDADREELVGSYEERGFDRATAECIADEIIEELPDGEDMYTFGEIDDASVDAVRLCE